MCRRTVMVLLLLGNDFGYGVYRGLIFASELRQLMLQVPQNNALYSHRGSGNRSAPKQPCDQSEDVTTHAA